ncbi:Fpg/Nei family DNA glycosylase [Paenibacillus jilunlii]|uniref:Formamidopyrimidine-DNA glycosylase n=1 Tax=Paenibacillus jilunlii TaxID=682956 RepID=A0A1G9K2N6_9BACL|nr:DNA-formamidopyrimidine glycosylase family protein [Paenibacillus jilunlii]KWX70067.1 formamidopyrimidine-DNA glycosylase [Paenibacillus jilunlii]SDL44041.1 DNA-(apurinic or apyrimidinic site) lyase [Paenibacillus jilunlii]
MPELPEMENYRKLLSQHLINVPITGVTVNREKTINMGTPEFTQALLGARIVFVERRAKHILFHLHDGRRLLLHLMLGGLLFYGTEEERPERSTQVELVFGDHILYFMGLRLGYLHLLSVKESEAAMGKLGPELLDRRMTPERFAGLLKGRRGALKSLMVNQQVMAGIGNCYADEIAFEARLLPTILVQNLTPEAVVRLYDSVRKVLTEATEIGGYMEMPFMAGDTVTGSYNDKCKVYDREGEPCLRDGGTIVKIELSGRKVFYCPDCQHDE